MDSENAHLWESLREAQIKHEIAMERDVQLSLLTGDQISATLNVVAPDAAGQESGKGGSSTATR